ncbi:MAG: acyl-CoA/acyl-ACP dehydrogenase [Proteobacteria bacterium]|nr:acyl-CoA/acyl-ACP dehydrogenase [Pseudomonadota bacterium]
MYSLTEASATAREPEIAAMIAAADRYLLSASGPARFRQARNSPDAAVDVAAYRGLAGLGLAQAVVPEAQGGSGLAPGSIALIAERLGHALAREPYVENVVLPVALLMELGATALLEAVGRDEILCLAWQEGPFDLPQAGSIRTQLVREGAGLRLRGTKRFVMGARASTRMIVLADAGGVPALVHVPAAAATRQDKSLADGTCWSDVTFDATIAPADIVAQGAACLPALTRALDLANLAIAGQLHGLQSRILELTLEYLNTRVQFDKPLGAFQALQHRAVELYNHAQITRFLLGEAIDATITGVPAATLAAYASRAKARASDAALRIAKEGIQMHGGIGFSDEYDLGLYVKRILVLSAWLGGAGWHRRRYASLGTAGIEA